MHFWSVWQSLSIFEKGGQFLGHPHGPSIKAGAQGAHGTPLARVLLVLLHVLPPSTLFALVLLKVHKKKKKYISLLCILICTSCLPSSLCKNVFVMVLLPRKNGFVVRHHPQE